jgi:alpha-1,2-mannosyltransferase
MLFQWKEYKKTNIIIRWLVFLILLNVGISLCLRLAGTSQTLTSLRFVKSMLNPRKMTMDDSWGPMITAQKYLDNNPKGPVYEEVLFKKVEKFQYPPTSLLIFKLPQVFTGMSYLEIGHLLDFFSWVCVFLIALISARILIDLLKKQQFISCRLSPGSETNAVYLLVFVLTLLNYPIVFSYNLGQIQTTLTLLGVLSILCWTLDKKYLVGLLIGITCLVKPQLATILVWAAIRKQWKVVIAGIAIIIPFLFVSLWYYGLQNHLEYLSVLSFLSHHGEGYYPNQSMNGLMNRVLFNGNNLLWDDGFPPYSPLVYTVTMASAGLFILPALFWHYKRKNPDVMELCIMILATTMASPIAWEHHYGIVLPIFIVLLPFAIYFYQNKKWELLILSIAFTLTAQLIEFVKAFAGSGLNILQSYVFFGALIILAFLYRISYLLSKQFSKDPAQSDSRKLQNLSGDDIFLSPTPL